MTTRPWLAIGDEEYRKQAQLEVWEHKEGYRYFLWLFEQWFEAGQMPTLWEMFWHPLLDERNKLLKMSHMIQLWREAYRLWQIFRIPEWTDKDLFAMLCWSLYHDDTETAWVEVAHVDDIYLVLDELGLTEFMCLPASVVFDAIDTCWQESDDDVDLFKQKIVWRLTEVAMPY